jgi:hypothetical protein
MSREWGVSDYGKEQRHPPSRSPGERQVDDPKHAGSSVEADRAWAQNRIANFLRGRRSAVMRKADSGAKGLDKLVSQPGDPAEQEADAGADHAVEGIHGGDKEGTPGRGEAGKEKAPPVAAKLSPATIALSKKDSGNADASAKSKPINLPAWKDIIIDLAHITSGHVAGGSRASAQKDKFPPGMTPEKIESAVRNAYKVCKKLQTQGDRVLVVGTADGLTIEMWVNTSTKTIETAYPQH